MTHESAMKTKTNLLATGMFLAAVFNGFGQPASKAPNSGGGLWQAAEQRPAEKIRKQRSLNGGTAPVIGLIEYVDTNASARSAFYRTVQP